MDHGAVVMDSIDLLKRALLDLAAVSEEGEGELELVYTAWAVA